MAALIWSSWYVLARHGVTGGALTPEDLAALRFLVAAPLAPVILRKLPITWANLKYALPMALGVGPAFGITVGYGFTLAPANFGGAMTAVTGVILSLLGAVLLFRERLRPSPWLGIGGAVVGLLLLILVSEGAAGLGYFLTGGALRACRAGRGLKAMEAAGAVAILSALIFLPPYFLHAGGALWRASAGELLLQGIGQGVLTGTVALALHARAVVDLGAAKGALFQSLVPPFTLVLSFLFLGEVPSGPEMAVILLVLCGVTLALRR